MIEILFLVGALGGIGNRARQRGLSEAPFIAVALVSWLVFLIAGAAGLGPFSLILRWLCIGGVYLMIEHSQGGASIGETWKCPDCLLFNDPGTLVCLCGYEHPKSPQSHDTAS